MPPAVTFVVPVFNGVPFLQEAVESVFRQTHPQWNILLIDDASSDSSRSYLQTIRDHRVRVLFNERNQGLYPTLADAIELVDTEWVSILMQDDRLKPRYLEEMLGVIRQNTNARAIWATEDSIDESGKLLGAGKDTARMERIQPGVAPWRSVLFRGCIWTISGSLTARSLFQQFPFRHDLPHCGDYEWLLRAIREAEFVFYERPLAEVRLHSGQASTGNLRSARDLEEQLQVLRENFTRHPDDIGWGRRALICWRRSRLIFRRILSALARSRPRHASLLSKYLLQSIGMGFFYKPVFRQ